jgi:hypothetical protein
MKPQAMDNAADESPQVRVARTLARAHHSLKLLREQIGRRPELEEAIDDIEVALSFFTDDEGGFL